MCPPAVNAAQHPGTAGAAFDDPQARTDPAVTQIFGSLPKAASASADRDKLRKQLGSQMVRQLILK